MADERWPPGMWEFLSGLRSCPEGPRLPLWVVRFTVQNGARTLRGKYLCAAKSLEEAKAWAPHYHPGALAISGYRIGESVPMPLGGGVLLVSPLGCSRCARQDTLPRDRCMCCDQLKPEVISE